MKLKTHEARGRLGICAQCRHALIMESERDIDMFCNVSAYPLRVRRPLMRCSDFEERTRESEFEMRRIAWTIRTDRSGMTIGFEPPKKDE